MASQAKVLSVNSFNFVVDEFMQKMILKFPNQTKIKVWYYQFKASKMLNPKIAMEYIMPTLVNMGNPIMTKDERFFMKDSFVNYAEGFSEKTGLVDIWDSISLDVKNEIWGYLQSIYVMGMNIMGETETLRQVIGFANQC